MSNKKHIRFDWAMKRILRNKANFGILEGFLSELLKFDVKIQEILESESNKDNPTAKYNKVDILVKDLNDDLILIEVQNQKEDDYFKRMHYGQAKIISERLEAGDAYEKLTKFYSINIVYFPLGIGNDYVYISDGNFRGMHTNEILELTEKQKLIYKAEKVKELFTQYYILKVNNFDDIAKDSLDEWIYFLKNNVIKDEFKAKGLEEAKEKLREIYLTKEEKKEYDNYVKSERIRNSEIKTAYTDGVFQTRKLYTKKLEEEKLKAEREKLKAERERLEKEQFKSQIVKTLNEQGNSIEEISKLTNISVEEIKIILKNQ